MRIIFGIGNPGKRYQSTKHNIGFMLLDHYSDINKIQFKASQNDYYYAEGQIGGFGFILVKPTTFVNNSGFAVKDLVREYSLDPNDLLVVHDDLNLNLGQIKIKQSGSDGGHNGVASVIYHLETDQFPRLRFGIGRDFQQGEMADYVLGKFTSGELSYIEPSIKFASSIIEEFIKGGTKIALDYFSRTVKTALIHTENPGSNENNTRKDA